MPRPAYVPSRRALSIAACAVAAAVASPLALAQQAGSVAPAFTLTDTAGKSVSLADFKGKYVVLEWTNPDCPFVQSHYNAKSMQQLQKAWGAKDVVWLTINSTNQDHPEYKTAAQMTAWEKSQGAAQSHVLIDGTSATGRAYAAKTTPQMFVVDPAGKVIYDGAADAHRTASASAHKAGDSYVQVALTEAMAGKPVTTASTAPYGCSVKY
ncbi:MAG: redoxin domain-containing protein [Proteobacteria bacterium]|nr:redoxin domain-containing protein [Pseudomonadota bacterium]